MKKVLLVPALSQYFLTLASEALKRGGKHRRFVTVFLMLSETVSVINLQILKSMLKSAQKCAIFTFKIQKFSGEGNGSLPNSNPFVSPQFVPSSPYLWICHWAHSLLCCTIRNGRVQFVKFQEIYMYCTLATVRSTMMRSINCCFSCNNNNNIYF